MAYLGLKVGTVPEAAIPIAILAVGIGYTYSRKTPFLKCYYPVNMERLLAPWWPGLFLPFQLSSSSACRLIFLRYFCSTFLGGCLGILFPDSTPPLLLRRATWKAAFS